MEPNQQFPHNTNNEQDELERRDFYLRTLFDISNDIFGTMDSGTILRNILLMTMGNFAVIEGVILIINLRSKETVNFVNAGFQNNELSDLHKAAKEALLGGGIHWRICKRRRTQRYWAAVSETGMRCALYY